jgi:hypothetical protein
MHSLHLPGDVLSFEHWKGPKKLHGLGHLWRETAAEITIEHNNQYPSHLFVPITKGNRIGTFLSGGILGPLPEH